MSNNYRFRCFVQEVNRYLKFPEPLFQLPKLLLLCKFVALVVTIAIPLALEELYRIISLKNLWIPLILFVLLVGFSFTIEIIAEFLINNHVQLIKRILSEQIVRKLCGKSQKYPIWNIITAQLSLYLSNYYSSLLSLVFQLLKVVIIVYYLYVKLGPTLFLGLLLCACIMYLTFSLAQQIQKYNFANVKVRQQKIELLKEFLNRVTQYKMMWLDFWIQKKYSNLQDMYMENLSRNKMLDCWCVGLWQFTSIGTSAIVLSVFYLWGGNELQIFTDIHPPTIIYYFNMLNFPLNALSWNVAGLFNAIKAMKNINSLLHDADHQENFIESLEYNEGSLTNNKQYRFITSKNEIIKVPKFQLPNKSIYCVIGQNAEEFLEHLISKSTFPISLAEENSWHLSQAQRSIHLQVDKNLEAIDNYLEVFHCGDIPLANSPETYSGGQKMRLSLARAFFHNGIVIINSQLTSLDAPLRKKIMQSILKAFITHDKLIVLIRGDFPQIQGKINVTTTIQISKSQPLNTQLHYMQQKIEKSNKIINQIQKQQQKSGQQKPSKNSKFTPITMSTWKLYYQSKVHISFLIAMISMSLLKHSYNYYLNTSQSIKPQEAANFSKNMLACLLAYIVAIYFRSYLFAKANLLEAERIGKSINKSVILNQIDFYTNQSSQEHSALTDKFTPSRLIHLSTSDLQTISSGYPFTSNILFNNIFQVLSAIIIMSYQVPILIVFICLIGFGVYKLDKQYRLQSQQLENEIKQQQIRVLKTIGDLQHGRKILLAFKQTNRFIEKYLQQNTQYMKLQRKSFKLRSIVNYKYRLTIVLFMALGIYFYVLSQSGNQGLAVLVNYAMLLANYILYLTFSIAQTQNKAVSFERVRKLLNIQPIVQRSELYQRQIKKLSENLCTNIKYQQRDKILNLENFSFCYTPDTPVLKEINLQLYRGDRVKLTGRSGAGKTTLYKVLAGLYNNTKQQKLSGNLYINSSIFISFSPQHPLILPSQQLLMNNIDPFQLLPKIQKLNPRLYEKIMQKIHQLFAEDKDNDPIDLPYNKKLLINNLRAKIYGINGLIIFDEPENIMQFQTYSLTTYIVVSHHKTFQQCVNYKLVDGSLKKL